MRVVVLLLVEGAAVDAGACVMFLLSSLGSEGASRFHTQLSLDETREDETTINSRRNGRLRPTSSACRAAVDAAVCVALSFPSAVVVAVFGS